MTFWQQVMQFGKLHLAYIVVAVVANLVGVVFHV